MEDIKLISVDEIASVLNNADEQYKFPQNSENALKMIKKKFNK